MSLHGWTDLICECGNKIFQQAYTIAWHENQGTTPKPNGWTCTGCGRRSDTAKMVAVAKQKQLQTKIAELQEQL